MQHRVREVCRHFGLVAPKVIVDFAAAECAVGNLSGSDIPSWSAPVRPVPFVEIPANSQSRSKKLEKRVAPEISEDTEMEDAPIPEQAQTIPRAPGKRRIRPTHKITPGVPKETAVTSGEGEQGASSSGAKRALADSPSRVEKSSKKKKTTQSSKGKAKAKEDETEESSEPDGLPEIDVGVRVRLGSWVMDEDTPVDPECVPGSWGKVHSGCEVVFPFANSWADRSARPVPRRRDSRSANCSGATIEEELESGAGHV